MPTKASTFAAHQGKFISDKLIARSELVLRFTQFANAVSLPQGMGDTVNFVGYSRTNVPVDKLVEGVTPDETPMSMFTQKVVVDYWGMYIALTDVAEVTTDHPVLNEALKLVGDSTARTYDYTIAEVLNAGTNVQYGDGSIANRTSLAATAPSRWSSAIAVRARTDMNESGAPGRSGDLFAGLIDPQVEADIMNETGTNSFVAAHQGFVQGKDVIARGRLGMWQGIDWHRSNFMPKFTRIATFGAPTAGAGGALTGTVFHKITRKNLLRGFEEDIQLEGSTAMAANTRLTFTAPATPGYVYNVYAGNATGDANLFLVRENLVASGVFLLDALIGTGKNPPATPPAGGLVVHAIYIFADEALDWVKLNGYAVEGYITPKGATDSDPLNQRRKTGGKWANKAGIRDTTRVKRIEVTTTI